LTADLTRYVTENRLRNLISKIGDISSSDKSKLIGLLAKDALKDFEADFEEFKSLPKPEQKKVTAKLSDKVFNLIDQNFEDILKNNF